MDRRNILKTLVGLGVGGPVFCRALSANFGRTRSLEIDRQMISDAEWVAGVELTEEERDSVLGSLRRTFRKVEMLRAVDLKNHDEPAVVFGVRDEGTSSQTVINRDLTLLAQNRVELPATEEELAFLPVTALAQLIKRREVSSLELTKLYLKRLKKFDPVLKCVVTLTEDLAIQQAKKADEEIAAGKYRGTLHGIPWGAKDLIAVPGYKTTWGAPQFREQELPYKATVAERLEQAGAVLIAKLSLGALAMGDQWFGGQTRCPWNYRVGSSGSSAGSAAATAAGLVGFTLGSETMGSIISPSRRCGTTGLRPTFGRVSRFGCMTLSWSMDKIGPITRSVEDAAIVFAAIHGADGKDRTALNRGFEWPYKSKLTDLKVGYVSNSKSLEQRQEIKQLKTLGVKLSEVKLPNPSQTYALTHILDVEAAAAFDQLTRSADFEGLNRWATIFQSASFVSAVDYLRAMRLRRKLQLEFEAAVKDVDIIVNANDLAHTNLTGHPSIAIPVGFKEKDGLQMPYSVVLTGKPFEESKLLALANALQKLQTAHLQKPPLEKQLTECLQEREDSKAE